MCDIHPALLIDDVVMAPHFFPDVDDAAVFFFFPPLKAG